VIVPNLCQQQDTCGGADTCKACARCKTRAWELDEQFTKDFKGLGFETNRKDVPPTTSAFFLGLGFDTVTLEFWVPLEKAQAFADTCKDLFEKGKATRREIAAIVGKLMWWNPAIFNAKLLSKALQQQTGGIDGAQLWDEVVQFSQLALHELQFWAHNTVEMATLRKPMILPRFEDLEIEWAWLESGGSGLQWFCLSLGRPPRHRRRPRWLRHHVVVARGTRTSPWCRKMERGRHRVRENQAAGFARRLVGNFGCACISSHMKGKAILHYSDCSCVVKALRDGSAGCDVLQEQALELWQLTSRFGILLLIGWVPGDRVIDLGADGLSRSEGQDWGGYGLNPSAWKLVCDKADSAGKKLTIDLFASASNAKCQRFHSFHHTQGAESADAFDRLSWAQTKCLCGQTHSEFVYAFPPVDLLLPMWICLQTDRAAGIAIVPMSPGAPWWNIMTSALQSDIQTFPGTSLTFPEGCAKINANNRLTNLEFAIEDFDFSQSLCPHKNSPTCTPICSQATTQRLPSAVPSASASAIAARRDLWRLLSFPSVSARNREAQDDLMLEKFVASQEW